MDQHRSDSGSSCCMERILVNFSSYSGLFDCSVVLGVGGTVELAPRYLKQVYDVVIRQVGCLWRMKYNLTVLEAISGFLRKKMSFLSLLLWPGSLPPLSRTFFGTSDLYIVCLM
ncbi:uncharacterized protein LOC113317219 [Papaver somniferum]|uniref:uncharacterized protein LOC113317219 n=1 Tax=Papaver somniferum TaxID=3469 RepID=UPI000E6F4756|nr:uncharacterized protein LOC113317219 [Papaver somniferum]